MLLSLAGKEHFFASSMVPSINQNYFMQEFSNN